MCPIKCYILLLFLINVSTEKVNSRSHYKAGIVEFHPFDSKNTSEITQKKLDSYLEFIEKASKESVDILIFPEATLNRNFFGIDKNEEAIKVPSEKDQVNPCNENVDKYSKVLRYISCSAKEHKMYVVINVAEYTECNENNFDCNDVNRLQFNTNVVFDRQGKIISRYRKIHLFGERHYTPSLDKALGIFQTDFGVVFGHFICFDLLYQEPTLQLLETERIKNIIFPTMWFAELPSFTAVEIQQAYAYKYNVNLLAANANNPTFGSSGSGIYSGKKGILKSITTGEKISTMLIAEVPKSPVYKINPTDVNEIKNDSHMNKLDDFRLLSNNMSLYKSILLDEKKDHQILELTDGDITCKFDVEINHNFTSDKKGIKHYFYRAVLLNGIRRFGVVYGGVIECQILACTGDEDVHSCAHRFKHYSDLKPVFEITKISIEASVPRPRYNTTLKCNNIIYLPVSALTTLEPLKINEFQMIASNNAINIHKININLLMTSPQSELLTFGLFGRVFYRDFTSSNEYLDEYISHKNEE